MKLLGKIFDKDTTGKLVDGAIGGVDKLFHTSEEKADDIYRHLTLMQGFKLLQRLLVMSITGVFLLVFLLAVVFASFGKVEVVKALTTLVIEWKMAWAFISIVGVYILGGVIPKKR